jgi:hypothetical protein
MATRTDYARDCPDFLLPKHAKVRRGKAKTPESELQDFANALLNVMGLAYLRLSSSALRSIFANPAVPTYVKKHVSDELGGWPDSMVFYPLGNGINLVLGMEIKTETGKLRASQKRRARDISMVVVRSRDEIEKVVKDFKKFAEEYTKFP